jgi:hypothetical protein
VRSGVAIASLVIFALLSQQQGLGEDSARITGVVFTAAQGDRAVFRERTSNSRLLTVFARCSPTRWANSSSPT